MMTAPAPKARNENAVALLVRVGNAGTAIAVDTRPNVQFVMEARALPALAPVRATSDGNLALATRAYVRVTARLLAVMAASGHPLDVSEEIARTLPASLSRRLA